MVTWELAYSKYALKDAKKIAAAGLKEKAQALLKSWKSIHFKIPRLMKNWLAI